jgi:thymidylate kinase
MSQFLEHIPIIAFDGNHRSGKGTQIHILESELRKNGLHPHILRGDGSRPGMGESDCDPKSEWWQNFKTYVKRFENEYDAWRIGARKLLAEAAVRRISLISDPEAVILFDRSHLSRTQMALKEGIEPTFKNMYSGINESILEEDTICSLRPNSTIYLDTPIDILTKRLDINDPKYEFRRNNIISSNGYYGEAFNILKNNNDNIIRIDGDQDPKIIGGIVLDVIMRQNIFNRKDINND